MKFGSALVRYLVAASIFAALLLLPFGFQRLFGLNFDTTFLIILAMVGCAWYLGRGPGLLVAVLFELVLTYFSTPASPSRAILISINRLMLFGGVVFFASARRKAEKDLRDQTELLSVTLSSIGDAVISTDSEGNIRFLNPTAEALTGWHLEEARGLPLDMVLRLVNEESRESVPTPFDAIKRDGVVVGLANHTILVSKNGQEYPIDDSGAPIKDAGGNVVGAIIVFHDVTERRRAEREKESLLAAERVARLEAETASRTKDEFLAMVSHELRTPLNAILGWAAMLRKSPDDLKNVQNGLAIIERNARSQNEIIGDILDVSRIISGKLDVELHPVHLNPILSAAIDSLRPSAESKAISIEPQFEGDGPLISADRERLQQVFWNLLSNAIKFTQGGGRICVQTRSNAETAWVDISDNGVGIAPDSLPYLFDRFHQIDSSIKRAHGGLGLGLAIVQHLVDLHGGCVTAKSDGLGRGSTFTIEIPVHALARNTVENRPTQKAGIADLSGVRVLVVDDNADSVEICSLSLEQHGAETRVARSVRDAVAILNEWLPDVLISDLGMPEEDGFDLITYIRSLPPEKGGEIPAAALTAYARESDRERALTAGFDIHIPKPIGGEQLAVSIAELVDSALPRNRAVAV